MLKMTAILKSKMAATGTNEKNGNNLICIPGSLLHHLRPKNQIVHESPTNNISNQTKSVKSGNLNVYICKLSTTFRVNMPIFGHTPIIRSLSHWLIVCLLMLTFTKFQ